MELAYDPLTLNNREYYLYINWNVIAAALGIVNVLVFRIFVLYICSTS